MKAFLALAVPATIRSGRPARPLSRRWPARWCRPIPGFVLSRDEEQVLALTGGQPVPAWLSDGAAKYQRLAYSSRFGFSLDVVAIGDGRFRRLHAVADRRRGGPAGAGHARRVEVLGELIASRWRPWPDVVVDTVLWGRAPGTVAPIASGPGVPSPPTSSASPWGSTPIPRAGPPTTTRSVPTAAVVTSPRGRSGLLARRAPPAAGPRAAAPTATWSGPPPACPCSTDTARRRNPRPGLPGAGRGPAGDRRLGRPPGGARRRCGPCSTSGRRGARPPRLAATGFAARTAGRMPRPGQVVRRRDPLRRRLRSISRNRGS